MKYAAACERGPLSGWTEVQWATPHAAREREGDAIPSLSLVTEDGSKTKEEVSPLSQELVIGFVGYAGAGCSAAAFPLEEILLQEAGYEVSDQ